MKNYGIKPEYEHRKEARYYTEDDNVSNVIHQPHVYRFAEFLAQKKGCKYIIDLGCGKAGKLVALSPQMHIIGVDHGQNIEYCQKKHKRGKWIKADLERGEVNIDIEILKQSFIVCSDVIEHLLNPDNIMQLLDYLLEYAQGAIVTTPERDLIYGADHCGPPLNPFHVREWNQTEFLLWLRSFNFKITNYGLTYSSNASSDKNTSIVILENNYTPRINRAPPDFRVLAIMNAYNEADIISQSLSHLIEQGIDVYLIDNWSTDGTYEIAKQFLGKGLIFIERFPHGGRNHGYHWHPQLERVAEIAFEQQYDWYIHHDVDEIREAPYFNISMKEMLYHVDRCGYNCVDHTILNFNMLGSFFYPGMNLITCFENWNFGIQHGHFTQIKAWKSIFPGKVNLASSGGHQVMFLDQKIFPVKFLTRHYPYRTIKQYVRKVYVDRKPETGEAAEGWNSHYIEEKDYSKLLREANSSKRFDYTFYSKYLVERLSGIGILLPDHKF